MAVFDKKQQNHGIKYYVRVIFINCLLMYGMYLNIFIFELSMGLSNNYSLDIHVLKLGMFVSICY